VRLNHLGLPVSDDQRSLRFYATHFGFDPGSATRYPDGTLIVRNADGFDLALHPHPEPRSLPAFLHFGFRVPSPDDVRAKRKRLVADGHEIISDDDEPDLVGFKVRDPDGYPVEVYWEP
jgi:catechol 2,3-dioxygenase-like lactoylglutathione lyase family enzyme